jgi:hypothetical protein
MSGFKYPPSLYKKMASVANNFKVPDYGQPKEPDYTGMGVKETDPILLEDAGAALILARTLVIALKKIYGYEPSIMGQGWELDGCLGKAMDIVEKLECLLEEE